MFPVKTRSAEKAYFGVSDDCIKPPIGDVSRETGLHFTIGTFHAKQGPPTAKTFHVKHFACNMFRVKDFTVAADMFHVKQTNAQAICFT